MILYFNKSVIKIALLVICFVALGCNKEKLNPIPQIGLTDRIAFSSPERILQQVFGVYSSCKSGYFLGGRAIVYNDIRGENWLNVTGNVVTALEVWNFSLTSSSNDVQNQWAAGYIAINAANVLLEGIDNNPGVVSTTLANQYKAEARFCRALCYFYLVNAYGRRPFNADNGASPGLPLRLTAAKGINGANLKRSTVAEVYKQILNDLDFAEANLPATHETDDENVVRAHKNAAIAFKTRVLLHMNRLADVISEANKIVSTTAPFQASSGVQHRLATNFTTIFRGDYNDRESIFSFPNSNTNYAGGQNGLSEFYNAEFSLNPAGVLAESSWKSSDIRRSFVVGTSAPFRYSKFDDDLNNYVPIIRYSEVLLNLAEALARQGSSVDSKAQALLNAVRQRADTTTSFNYLSKQELIDQILKERRIEFLGEGMRTLDILRLNIPFPSRGGLTAVAPTALPYVWPVPDSELLYNTAMTSNN